MIHAFGPRAQRYAHTLGDINAVVSDLTDVDLVQAYLEALRRRGTGEPFYGMVLQDDPRVAFGYRVGQQILSGFDDYDMRRSVTQQLCAGSLQLNDGERVDELWQPNRSHEYLATEFLALCDASLVRSWHEYGRQCSWFDQRSVQRPYRPVERILGLSAIPVVARRGPPLPTVLIWAPLRGAFELALHLQGLFEFIGRVVCVTAGGPPPERARAEFMALDDPMLDDVLATASAVLCPEPSDPADAVAFARLGYGVVAPMTSGAHEFAGEIVAWDALNTLFLAASIGIAMARPASVHTEPAVPPRAPSMPQRPAFVDEGDLPLVSIITPTYNRRDDLLRALGAIAAQTYPNIESVVVNDAGVAVEDIVAEFPFARLVNLPENLGAFGAQEVGYHNCRGEYVTTLPDDDWFNPDHVERLVTAMVRSGCSVAHGTGLLRFVRREEDGTWFSYGFNATTFCQTVGPTDALITSNIANQQMIAKLAVFQDVGWYLPDSNIADNELLARVATRYAIAFVDHTTSEFRTHEGQFGSTLDLPGALEHMYEVLHPVPDRPVLMKHRQATLDKLRARGQFLFPPTFEILKPTSG